MILDTLRDASTGPAGHILLATIIVAVGLMLLLKSARDASRFKVLSTAGTVASAAATIVGLIYLAIAVLQ